MHRWMKLAGAGAIGLGLAIGAGISLASPPDHPTTQRADEGKDHGKDHDRRERPRFHRRGPIRDMGRAVRGLELDEAQRTAIREVFTNSRDEAKRIFTEESDPQKRREAFRTLVERIRGEVESKLNDEQRTRFASRLDELRQRDEHRQMRRSNEGRRADRCCDCNQNQPRHHRSRPDRPH